MGGIFGGGGGQSTNTVTSSGPPAYLQPFLSTLASNANAGQASLNASGSAAPLVPGQAGYGTLAQPFQGQAEPGANNPAGTLVAPFTPNQITGQNLATSTANNVTNNIQPTAQNAMSQISQMMQPGANGQNSFQNTANSFNPLSSSDLTSAIQSQLVPVTQQYQEQILPQITDQAVQQGAYGGTRASTVQGQAARDYTQSINNVAGSMLYQNEEQQNSNQLANIQNELQGNSQTLSAAGLVPQLGSAAEQQGLDASNIYNTVGGQQQTLTQNQIAAAANEYAGQQNAPFTGMSQLEAALGIGGGAVSTSNVSSNPSSNLFGSLAAGALGINGLANSSLLPSNAGFGNFLSNVLPGSVTNSDAFLNMFPSTF